MREVSGVWVHCGRPQRVGFLRGVSVGTRTCAVKRTFGGLGRRVQRPSCAAQSRSRAKQTPLTLGHSHSGRMRIE